MYRAGAASIVITPTEPMWLAGFAVRTKPSNGTLADLKAKALAIWDEHGEPFVIVTMDLIAISRDIATSVAREVETKHKLPRARLLFGVSHTHYGPEVRPDKAPFFHIPPEYAKKIAPLAESLKAKLVALIGDALKDLRPARLFARQGSAGFAHNRRANVDPIDHDVPVLEVTDPEGKRRAIVFGYACHNTTIPPEDGRFCGDWAGFAQQHVEAENPGAVAMFLTGAAADQNPVPRGSIDLSRQYGRELADAVTGALKGEAREIHGPIVAAMEEVPLDFQPLPSREKLEADAAADDVPSRTKARFLLDSLGSGLPTSHPCPVQVIRLGSEMLLLALGGEVVVDYSVKFKSRFATPPDQPGPLVWVAAYCNDMFGYVPTVRVQREGGYEGGRAMLWSALPMPFTETVEPRLTDAVERLVKRTGSSE
ncbi:MAG: hypothetical protein WBD40_25620 [Tepidisphaeraceae bacterium]